MAFFIPFSGSGKREGLSSDDLTNIADMLKSDLSEDRRRIVMRYFKYSLLIILLLSALTVNAKEIKEKRVVAAVDADGVQRVEIVGGEYFFDPNYIVVRMNIPVELIVKKESGLIPIPHNITIKAPEASIKFDEDMGTKPHIIRFTPTMAGKYPIICDKRFLYFFTKHDDKGMKGVLEVVP